MDQLLELLNQAEGLDNLSDEELATLQADIRARSAELLADSPDDDSLELLERAANVVDSIDTELAARAETETARQERADALAARIAGETVEEEADPEETEETPAEEETPEPVEAEVVEEIPEPVAASARVTRVAARRPKALAPKQTAAPSGMASLVASANLPDMQAGSKLDTPEKLTVAFEKAFQASRGYKGASVKVYVGRAGNENVHDLFGAERTLDMDYASNQRKISQVTSPEALTASGGKCSPSDVSYDVTTLGVMDRPVRDSGLVRYGADRGGIRTLPPPVIDDVEGAVDVWTEANDQLPVDPTVKPCLTVTCPSEDETVVEAITKCLEFGNFRARFFPEQVTAWTELASVWHARFAENRLLSTIATGSTQITSAETLGASIDLLTTLDRGLAAFRSRHRLARSYRMRMLAPYWLLDMLRADITRQLPGVGTFDEKMAAADAAIEGWISSRGVNITWFLDGESGQVFGPQPNGTLAGWPDTVIVYLYPEGSWLFLDGGTLDLGIVRDSTLNSTNDYRIFAETFEAAHFHGIESWRLTLNLCPFGGVAGTVDTSDLCASQS